ncbi:Rapid ALkalinization Factor [Heracleum sosnowskyi]|uniref:Rapid ALkalinization Factor n=1 Tax=Heracleum sosnowskyi TaxID=360622 RepID=A0AAD8IBV9_9APIA|nr:Rapid ALkalinization Factor [Heracleum sosnowskyi]
MRRNANKNALCSFLVLVTLLCLIKPFSSMIVAENSWLDESTREFSGSLESLNMAEDISLRRILEAKRYISPGALKRDQPVCDGGGRGESYSRSDGCLPPQSHPYTRGCSKYYRCRSDS